MKQVTVLFCDIVNSTPLTERLGPEGMSDVVRAFLDASLAEIRRFGGHRLLAECLAQESPAVAAEHVDAAQRIFASTDARNDLAKALVTRAGSAFGQGNGRIGA
jgi:class 3 adenylate cyclase